MWSTYILCFSVGLAASTSNYAWKPFTKYHYDISGRTLGSLHEEDKQFTGIVLRAQLTVQPTQEGALYAKLSAAQYAPVHAKLPGGWGSQIPDSQLDFQRLQLTNNTFLIQMENGAVQELVVDDSISYSEANVIMSVVSQIQVDVQGKNVDKSRLTESNKQFNNISAEFKTMENTAIGQCETLYDISELPEYTLQSKPQLVPLSNLKGDGQFIDVVKTRNYSNCDEPLVYHYGLCEIKGWEPASKTQSDDFLISSQSRIILSGSLKHNTIQSSVTTNKIIFKPTPNQKGLVVSQLNITLTRVEPISSEPQELQQRQQLSNLVHQYNNPNPSNKQAREDSEDQRYGHRHPRSLSLSNGEQQPHLAGNTPRLLTIKYDQRKQVEGGLASLPALNRMKRDRKANLKACYAGATAFAATNGVATAVAPNPITAVVAAVSGAVAAVCGIAENNV